MTIPESKKCSKCKIVKNIGDFCKDRRRKTGTQSSCKLCTRAGSRASYIKHRETTLLKTKEWAANNKEYHKELKKKWYSENKEYHNAVNNNWRNDNKDRHNANTNAWWKAHPDRQKEKNAKRRASKLKATPPWLTLEQRKEIQAIYKFSQSMSEFHEETFHVDHIEPLRGKTSCGLHVPWNLQILPAKENITKNNKLLNADTRN